MKSIVLSLVAAMALWLGGTFTSSADAQYRTYYRGGYSSAPRYSRAYYPRYSRGYYPQYYSRGYYNYPYRSYYRGGYASPYYGGSYYYNRPYYGGYYGSGYYSPGVSVGVGPIGIRAGF